MSDLRSIRTFDDLRGYLQDELDWPLEDYAFEDITFPYAPHELGLRDEEAVQVKTIHQLRPLHHGQPWGIFFVEFEKKRLPVVILRRILRHLVLKKRASANKAEAKQWQARDLIFISAWGEANDRTISFAHFVDHADSGLAELRVLGWDDDDTPLKMDYVARMLQDKLRWDDKLAADPEAWRARWASAFVLRHQHVIKTSNDLAEALAGLAKRICSRIRTILRSEDGFGEIRKLQKAFREGLIHDLDDDAFADMFAQTVTYGLFSLACRRTIPGEGTAFAKEDLQHYFTSPFLKEMLCVFLGLKSRKGNIDFDELGVSDVTDLLQSPDTHMEVVLRDFNNKTRGEDPVIHFYEHFLKAYNKALKVQRGVFYTPQPVVSYIVRSIHELLQTEFGLEDGLASTITWGEFIQKSKINNPQSEIKLPPKTDEPGCTETIDPYEFFVLILDPATGTATFPVEVIDVIFKHLKAKWESGGAAAMPSIPNSSFNHHPSSFASYWNEYVPKALLPRLYGYELMMAPYAIAHMKVGLKLAETGYNFATDAPVRIYLTNALEPKVKQLPVIGFDALAHEASAVNEVKWYKRFTVVVGNPPYAGHSVNNQLPWIVDKVHDYKRGLPDLQKPGQAKWLQDDYVKFLRFAEVVVNQSAIGVVGMITNHSFLDNPTFRGLRRSLIASFTGLRFLDLHGNTKGREKNDAASKDQNVFDIQQGVGISLLTAGFGKSAARYGELWGSRESKYSFLQKSSVRTSLFEKLLPVPEYYLFIRQDIDLRSEYERGISIHKAMGENGDPAPGIVTTQDEFAIAFTKSEMRDHIAALVGTQTEKEARVIFRLCTQSQWNYANAKRELKKGDWVNEIEPILYRPFDMRWTVFNPHVAVHRRLRVTRHLLAWKNLALVTTRSVEIGRGFEHIICTRGLIQHHTVSLKEVNFVIPLYLRPDADELGFSKDDKVNLSPGFLSHIANSLSVAQEVDGLPKGLTPEDIFHYIYAVFHSPGYRTRYAEFLKIDFPRVPLTGSLELFRALARLGGELTALHMLEFETQRVTGVPPVTENNHGQDARAPVPASYALLTTFSGDGREVTKPGWTPDHGGTVWLDAGGKKAATTPGTCGFAGVPEAVWNFHIGGYQVCEKWLKDRKGRTLTADDIAHYHKIVIALANTIRLMGEIDQVIDAHGGWPGAFTTAQANNTLPMAADKVGEPGAYGPKK